MEHGLCASAPTARPQRAMLSAMASIADATSRKRGVARAKANLKHAYVPREHLLGKTRGDDA